MTPPKKYFLSFVKEGIMNPNPKYDGYVAGRIEVWSDGPYDVDEIRYFTNKLDEFRRFSEGLDFKRVDKKELERIKKHVTERFYDKEALK